MAKIAVKPGQTVPVLRLIFISIAYLFAFSCTKNSEEMNLKGVLNYNWNTSIEEVKKDFNKKKYSEIKISKAETREAEVGVEIENKINKARLYLENKAPDYISAYMLAIIENEDVVSDYISAEMNYDGSPALITIEYFNKQIFNGDITIDELKKDEVSEIKEKQIVAFKKKYGEPQETENDAFVWNFKNNSYLRISSYCSDILAKCNLRIIFANNALFKEKEASNEQKLEEIKERVKEKIEKQRAEQEAKNLRWLEENKEKVKERVKGKLMISSDDFKEVKWINSTHRKTGNLLEKLYLYIPIIGKSTNASLRMVINHIASSDRRFNTSNEYEFKIDGKRETLELESDEKINFEYGSRNYYESFDVNIDRNEIRVMLLEDIASSKKTIVRFEGERYYEDREISEKEKEGIETILLTYEYLKNGGSLEDIL